MNNKSFGKSYRLLTKGDFAALREESMRFGTTWLRAYARTNCCDRGRIGISVSKKVSNAVGRNRFKRVVRDYFRHSKLRNKNLDILIVVNPNLTKKITDPVVRDTELRKSLITLEKKALGTKVTDKKKT